MRTLFFLLAVLASTTAYSIKEIKSDSLKGAAITPTARTLSAVNSRYPNFSGKAFWVNSSSGMVKFSYALPSSATTRPTGVASVNVNVTYIVEENGTWKTKTKNTTLTLNFQTATAADVAYFKVDKAQSITATIQSSGTSIPAAFTGTNSPLKLEAIIETESYTLIKPGDISKLSLNAPAMTVDSNLNVSWTSIPGAESYDLEWTYVSDHALNPVHRRPVDSVQVDPLLFRNNSTRVSVINGNTSYQIPMIYEPGVILYRVRGVGKNINGNVLIDAKTDWTVKDGRFSLASDFKPNGCYVYNGMEPNMNWQSSVSFAEEGKNKVVVSYHDGSLRNRQAVTRINSDQRAIVGETFYDYNGRPVVQVLPVPVTDNRLSFYPNFNLVQGATQQSKSYFDNASAGNGCSPVAPALRADSGASRYYSASNPFGTSGNTGKNLLNRNLIPDAQLYPYTQTYYTPDNTGRIAAQSGVGPNHTIGSGRETRYFYGAPQQVEITRLFGNQAGYAQHYKKNVVVDANGQASVSYLDMNGKVVATGLAGDSSGTLHGLGGNHARSINAPLLPSSIANQPSADGLTRNYTYKFPVTGTNVPYQFQYSANIGQYNISCNNPNATNPRNYNVNGAVDIEFFLQDKCGNNLFDLTGSTGTTQSITLRPSAMLLNPGEYQVTKNLKINDAQLEQYWQQYVADTGSCILTQYNFVTNELKKVSSIGCNVTCATCQHMVDSLIASSSIYTTEQQAILRQTCAELCDKDITCLASLQAMLGDMSPGGQYGELRPRKVNQQSTAGATFDANNQPVVTKPDIALTDGSTDGFDKGDPADNQVDPTQFPLSIFNPDNRIPLQGFLSQVLGSKVTKPYWQYPLQVYSSSYYGPNGLNQVLFQGSTTLSGLTYDTTEYKDKNGNIAYADIYKLLDANSNIYYSPAITDPSQLQLVDAVSGLYRIPVRFLKNVADFEKLWQPQWANFLVPYHPEFLYYLDCTGNHSSNAFDYALIRTTTIADAQSAGYVDATGTPKLIGATAIASKDSLAYSDPVYFKYQTLRTTSYQTQGSNTYSMAVMATMAVGCPRTNGCKDATCTDGLITTDDEWNVYRGLYLAEKQAYVRTKEQKIAAVGKYYNGCIGHEDFLVSDPESKYMKLLETTPVTITYQSCHRKWSGLFRFTTVCNPVTYTGISIIPYYNDPAEVCFVGRSKDYKDRTARFFPYGPSGMGGGQPSAQCSTLVDDGAGNTTEVSTPCSTNTSAAMQAAQDDARYFKYTSCGQCPAAADMEQFLMDLTGADSLVRSANMIVTCELTKYHVNIGEALRNLLFNGISSPTAYWSSVLSNGGKTLTGTIANGATIYGTVTLNIPSTVSATYTALTQLCCLSVTSADGKSISLTATYMNGKIPTTFTITGTSSVALSPCTLNPKCVVTKDAGNAALFLNTLLVSISGQKNNDFITNGTVLSLTSTAGNKVFYEYPVRELSGKDNRDGLDNNAYPDDVNTLSPTWHSTVSGNLFDGIFSYTDERGAHNIVIDISGLTAAQLTQVVEFTNLRVDASTIGSTDPCRTQQCQRTSFVADATLMVSGQKQYVTVTITTTGLQPVACKPALAPTN